MLFTYSKMTVLTCLKSLTLSAVGIDDRMLRNKFVVVCKCPEGRDTINCQMPGPRDSSWNKCPGFARGGMLAVGIDSHIRTTLLDLQEGGKGDLPTTARRLFFNNFEIVRVVRSLLITIHRHIFIFSWVWYWTAAIKLKYMRTAPKTVWVLVSPIKICKKENKDSAKNSNGS